jgi:uncharacterized protein (TIGR02271 family)
VTRRDVPGTPETRSHDRPEPQAEPLERVQERLVADAQVRQAGAVGLTKRVVEEPEELEITLRHDEIDLDRRPVDRPLGQGEKPVRTAGETTVVLVVEERLEVRRVPWVVEEIHVRRRLVSDTQEIRETVRKERWEIQPQGDVKLDQP